MSGGYADVNGIKLYHEIYGQGEPLVLIHGACRETTLTRPGSIRKVIPLPRDELSIRTGTNHAKRPGSPDGEPC